MESDMVVLFSGWLFAVILVVYYEFFERRMKDDSFEDCVARVIDKLNAFWDSPHMRRRAKMAYALAKKQLKEWWESD